MAKLNKTPLTIRAKRGTAAEIEAYTGYQLSGEFGYATDTNKLYVSNGTQFLTVGGGTLQSVTDEGNTTTNAIEINSNILSVSNNIGSTIRLNTEFSSPSKLQFTQEFSQGVYTQIAHVSNQYGTGLTLNSLNNVILSPGNTEKMRITSTGSVGIGTTAPSRKLHVGGILMAQNIGGSYERSIGLFPGNYEQTIKYSGNGLTIQNSSNDNDLGAGGGNVVVKLSPYATNDRTTTLSLGNKNQQSLVHTSANGLLTVNSATSGSVMAVTSAGNVGIGTTAPTAKLEVIPAALNQNILSLKNIYGTTGFDFSHVTSPSEGLMMSAGQNTNLFIKTLANGADEGIKFLNSSDTELLTILKDGNVGIGTTAPAAKLHVVGASRIQNELTLGDNTGTAGKLHFRNPGFGSYIQSNGYYIFNTLRGVGNQFRIKHASASSEFDINTLADDGVWYLTPRGPNSSNGKIVIRNPNNSDKFVFDTNAGNVGIGTTAPAEKLDVVGNIKTTEGTKFNYSSNTIGEIRGNANTYNNFDLVYGASWDGTNWIDTLGAYQSHKMTLGTGGIMFYTGSGQAGGFPVAYTERMRIGSNGSVAIGSTNTATGYTLYVAGNVGVSGLATTGDITLGENRAIRNLGSTIIDIDSNNNGTADYFAVTKGGYVSSTTLLKVEQDGDVIVPLGNVGIGTSAPAAKLDVKGSSAASSTTSLLVKNSDDFPLLKVTDDGVTTLRSTAQSLSAFRITDHSGVYSLSMGQNGNADYLFSINAPHNFTLNMWNGGVFSISKGITNKYWQVIAGDDIFSNEATSSIYSGSSGAFGFWTHANTQAMPVLYQNDRASNSDYGFKLVGKTAGAQFIGLLADRFGNVGIGTTAPSEKLEVAGNIKAQSLYIGDGAANTPSLAFASDTNIGIFRSGENLLNFIASGPSIILSGNDFYGNLGGSFRLNVAYGNASKPTYSFNNYSNNGMFRPSGLNAVAFSTAGIERLRIDGSGNVGINTTAPAAKLHVQGTGYTANSGLLSVQGYHSSYYATAEFKNSTDQPAFIDVVGGAGVIGNAGWISGIRIKQSDAADTPQAFIALGSNSRLGAPALGGLDALHLISHRQGAGSYLPIAMWTGNSPRMIIDTAGNVGIGTTTPTAKLHIVDATDPTLKIGDASNRNITLRGGTSSRTPNISSYSGLGLGGSDGAFHAFINNAGNVGIGTTTPAAKLDVSDSNSTIAVFRTTSASADLYLRASDTTSDGKVGIRASANNLRFISNGATQAAFNVGNLGLGTSAPSEKLDVVGNIKAEGIASPVIRNEGNIKKVINPGGGQYSLGTGSATGALVIKFPDDIDIGSSYVNYQFAIQIAGQTISPIEFFIQARWLVGLFNDLNGYSTSAENFDYKISVGKDGTNKYLIIGETTTSWVRNSFTLKEVSVDYINPANIDAYRDGWEISIMPDISAITTDYSLAHSDYAYQAVSAVKSNATLTASSWNTIATLGSLSGAGVFVLKRLDQAILSFTVSESYGRRHLNVNYYTALNTTTIEGVRITTNGKVQVLLGSTYNSNWEINCYYAKNVTLTAEVADPADAAAQSIDITGNNVGEIHTDAFAINQSLTVKTSTGTDTLYAANTGDVGIGNTSPSEKLHVSGNVIATGGTITAYASNTSKSIISNVSGGGRLQLLSDTGDIYLRAKGGDSYFNAGKVGIGNTTPTSKLHVNAAAMEQFRIETPGGPTGSGDTKGNVGDIAYDADFFYIKTDNGWGRVPLDFGF